MSTSSDPLVAPGIGESSARSLSLVIYVFYRRLEPQRVEKWLQSSGWRSGMGITSIGSLVGTTAATDLCRPPGGSGGIGGRESAPVVGEGIRACSPLYQHGFRRTPRGVEAVSTSWLGAPYTGSSSRTPRGIDPNEGRRLCRRYSFLTVVTAASSGPGGESNPHFTTPVAGRRLSPLSPGFGYSDEDVTSGPCSSCPPPMRAILWLVW